MTRGLHIPNEAAEILSHGGLLAINHSGGKDSQAMTIKLINAGIPHEQLVIVHAHLGRIEWPGTIEHIEQTTYGLPVIVAQACKSFFDMVKARGMFPSPKYRQFTSDLKRGPIERELRAYLKSNCQFGGKSSQQWVCGPLKVRRERSDLRYLHLIAIQKRDALGSIGCRSMR